MASRREMRDRLTLGGLPGPGAAPQRPPAETHALGFDETTVQYFIGGELETPFFRFGPMNILKVPPNINLAVVKGLCVNGNPMGFFDSRCWWTLRLETGGLQEFLGKDSIIPGPPAPPTITTVPIAAGIRHTHFGSLQQPELVNIQLPQSAVLQLVVLAETAQTLTVYTRVFGEYYAPSVGMPVPPAGTP